jgi:hypothetical protein
MTKEDVKRMASAVIEAGYHERHNCPVTLPVPSGMGLKPGASIEAICAVTDRFTTAQAYEINGKIHMDCILDFIPIEGKRVYAFKEKGSGASTTQGVVFKQWEDNLAIWIEGQYFSSYYFGENTVKPYLGPVMSASGDALTRLDFETMEHPHHRSLWISHGSVNGVDTWNEPEGKHGRILHKGIDQLSEGPVFGQFTAHNTWTDFDRTPLLNERTTFKIYNTPSFIRMMDITIQLESLQPKLVLGQTKEAGPIAVRVAESMNADHTGTFVNAYGAVNESECWMQRAPWCDYTGWIRGKQYGIAILDASSNEHHPPFWHIRNYGLMAPNNYHILGERLLSKGERVTFQYRILFHTGDAQEAGIAEQYHNFVNPPRIDLCTEDTIINQ